MRQPDQISPGATTRIWPALLRAPPSWPWEDGAFRRLASLPEGQRGGVWSRCPLGRNAPRPMPLTIKAHGIPFGRPAEGRTIVQPERLPSRADHHLPNRNSKIVGPIRQLDHPVQGAGFILQKIAHLIVKNPRARLPASGSALGGGTLGGSRVDELTHYRFPLWQRRPEVHAHYVGPSIQTT